MFARHALPHQPELPVVEAREVPQFDQVPQHEREVVVLVDAAQVANAPHRLVVAESASERIARVCRVGDHPAVAQDLRRLGVRFRPTPLRGQR